MRSLSVLLLVAFLALTAVSGLQSMNQESAGCPRNRAAAEACIAKHGGHSDDLDEGFSCYFKKNEVSAWLTYRTEKTLGLIAGIVLLNFVQDEILI